MAKVCIRCDVLNVLPANYMKHTQPEKCKQCFCRAHTHTMNFTVLKRVRTQLPKDLNNFQSNFDCVNNVTDVFSIFFFF